MNSKKSIGLYIHVPFCEKKCPYCDFYSKKPNNNDLDEYTQEICDSIKVWSKKINKKSDTLYFGGGTPSILGAKRICDILKFSKKFFKLTDSEVTLELNPTNYNNLDFERLYYSGINRLSIGLQSSNEKELFLLGRTHTPKDVQNTVKLAKKAGFKNISVDLMIATPSQTKKTLLESVKFCNDLDIQHISAYILKIEKNTLYFKNQSKLKLKSDDEQSDMYLMLCEKLDDLGFKQYEISSFSKPNFESRHNLKYWNCEEYLGLGPSAHSFINNKRFYFSKSLKKSELIEDGYGGSEEEYCMLKLRLSSGLTNQEYKNIFNHNIPKSIFEKAFKYKNTNLIKIDNESIKFTPKGFLVSNQLISRIIL